MPRCASLASHRPRGRLARSVVLVGLGMLASRSSAPAQSNSLFQRGASTGLADAAQAAARPRTPGGGTTTTLPQPAAPQRAAPLAGGMQPGLRPVAPSAAMATAVNPVLLTSSTIAVRTPEPQRIQVHDQITVIVREDKQAVTNAKLESKKDWKVDSALEQWFRLDKDDRLVGQFPQGPPGVDFDFKGDYKGEGRVNRKDSLITRIQATVVDVKPNGTLVLEARKEIQIDEEKQAVTLTGTCRAADVSAQNTILSTQIADLTIRTRHSGAARDATRRGWLMRAFDFLRPI